MWAQNQRKPGRPLDYARRIETCKTLAGYYQQQQAEAESRLETLRQETRRLRDGYHPFNLQTGAARKESSACRELTAGFDRLDQLAEQSQPTEKSRKRLDISERG